MILFYFFELFEISKNASKISWISYGTRIFSIQNISDLISIRFVYWISSCEHSQQENFIPLEYKIQHWLACWFSLFHDIYPLLPLLPLMLLLSVICIYIQKHADTTHAFRRTLSQKHSFNHDSQQFPFLLFMSISSFVSQYEIIIICMITQS